MTITEVTNSLFSKSFFRSLRDKRLTNEELFYYQRMQYLRYIPHYKKEVLANRSQFNITDTLIKVLKGGFLELESPYGSSFVTILPVGKFPVQFNGFHLGEFVQRLNFSRRTAYQGRIH